MTNPFKNIPKKEPGTHPECRESETFIGNYTVEQFKKLGYLTKRAGSMALDPRGNPSDNPNLSPVFISTEEFRQKKWMYKNTD
ncbi:MAG: hypothetical protein A2931_02530 [Candidatus Niyogibacteria bacterium RIFCSPLOWO2_01_FULL_45_48]|uniref:Uncharacterized protein n=1 Tax=Candidatus Niyogibacteria bacterium RIFCSPLOWO2_01_FULL_45_48 TaxID=1801724 RepID=A0A1G2EYX7_9BACT|nr:MAG: hypothetical protein A2835_03090 [Candidatus Niyogibacteria bacterium RIFCSPHIGHO2_01_FULL_45_28]OGZ30963.1 MAG: hypothetical protein A2931_02530 [Candidatus Niyogibacteria bacterium RIFCSPLOWO2_01_FULL_45_48]